MYNLTILSFVPNQYLNGGWIWICIARGWRALMKLAARRVIFNLFNSCPCTCCVCIEQRVSHPAAKAQCEFARSQSVYMTNFSLCALCSHSKASAFSLYIYKYARGTKESAGWRVLCKFTLLWAEKIKPGWLRACVSELVLVDEKSLHLWFVIYVVVTAPHVLTGGRNF